MIHNQLCLLCIRLCEAFASGLRNLLVCYILCCLHGQVTSQVCVVKDVYGEWQDILTDNIMYFCRQLGLRLPAPQPSKDCTPHRTLLLPCQALQKHMQGVFAPYENQFLSSIKMLIIR